MKEVTIKGLEFNFKIEELNVKGLSDSQLKELGNEITNLAFTITKLKDILQEKK